MIKTLLCCSLLVGGAQAMTAGPTRQDIIIDLSFLYSESVPEQDTTENGPCYELWKCRTICGQEPEKKDSPVEGSKLLAILKKFEEEELQDKANNSEE